MELNIKQISSVVVAVTATLLVTACGGGGSSSSPTGGGNPPPPPPPPPPTGGTTLTGSVGDGPITGSSITAATMAGSQVANAVSTSQATYSLEVPNGTAFPVMLVSTGGTDLVTNSAPDFELHSTALVSSAATANLNPHGTITVKNAQARNGGLTSANVGSAQAAVFAQLGFGLDTNVVSSPLTTPVSVLNVAAIVKSSEALSEAVRRTRDELQAAGFNFSADDVIDALSGDLNDGVIDGLGPGADARAAATFTVASAQVLVEALINRIEVGGADATSRMDQAIAQAMPGATNDTEDVRINQSLLDQATLNIAAVQAFLPGTALDNLANDIATIPDNSTAATVRGILGTSAPDALDQAVTQIASGTGVQHEDVNDVVRNGGASTPPPPPPVVSGDPALLYSDLVEGPAGAFVTVWGHNIPGNATFTCGNEPCDVISFDFDLNFPAHGSLGSRQKIVVRYNSGSGITLDGWNTLPYQVNNGTIWEINPGPIGPTLDQMSPGDVLYLRGGTYNVVDSAGFGSIMWADDSRDGLAVIGYPGERVILDLSNTDYGFDTLDDIHNWTLANFECHGKGNITTASDNSRCIHASRAGSRTNFRVVNVYGTGLGRNGGAAWGGFSFTVDLYVLGNFAEDTGTSSNQTHSFYHGGRGTNRNVNFEFNRVGRHVGRRGIQIYGHINGENMTQLRIRYNDVFEQGSNGILVSHTDGQSGDPETRCWISDALVEGNTVTDTSQSAIRFLGCDANPAGGTDFIARGNYVQGNIVADFPTGVIYEDNCATGYTGDFTDAGGNETNYPNCN